MQDHFEFKSPLGFLGRLADVIFSHATWSAFCEHVADVVRSAAEAGEVPK